MIEAIKTELSRIGVPMTVSTYTEGETLCYEFADSHKDTMSIKPECNDRILEVLKTLETGADEEATWFALLDIGHLE